LLNGSQWGGLGIYIHWPYCEAKCPYCDFNSFVARSIDHDAWRLAYKSELKRYFREFPKRSVASVFFGGGTPSLMQPRTVGQILDQIDMCWGLSEDVEVTLEANPSSVEKELFIDFRAAGVNRVSLGVQALNDPDLRRLGRLHTVEDALKAMGTAQSVFARQSMDLIFARQNQTREDWQDELQKALRLGFSHMSLYLLTIEPNTAFGRLASKGQLDGLPNEALAAQMFLDTRALCAESHLRPYEISNYARDGQHSMHNMLYWTGADYLGIGPGAHGRLTLKSNSRVATTTYLQPSEWLSQALQGNGEDRRESLSPDEHFQELLLMGLRLAQGVSIAALEQKTGKTVSARNLNKLRNLGAVTVLDDVLRITSDFVQFTETIVVELTRD